MSILIVCLRPWGDNYWTYVSHVRAQRVFDLPLQCWLFRSYVSLFTGGLSASVVSATSTLTADVLIWCLVHDYN